MNIFVSSLSFNIDNDELRGIFEEFGEVSTANVILDKFTRKSRGFGFVDMPNKEEAEKAISSLDGTFVAGRTIAVAEAREREPRENNNRRENNRNFSNRW